MKYHIVPLQANHAQAISTLMAEAYNAGEVLYKPLSAEEIAVRFFKAGMSGLAAIDSNDRVLGFVQTTTKQKLLPNETDTPVFLSLFIVAPECRKQGIGSALLDALKQDSVQKGRHSLCISSENPLQLTWIIPDTPGHDHNNPPGLWEDCAGAEWLLKHGFEKGYREISLYTSLDGWKIDPAILEKQKKLADMGIYTGRWQPGMPQNFDGMCDRVGSEYWRHVLQTELQAWNNNTFNQDPTIWADGRQPEGPRPILVAIKDDQIVGFTGPVDLQASGRGWFTGICADPACGGMGIGAVLFNLLLQEFVDEGAAFCSIFTGRDNHAQKIYFRAGLRQTASWAVANCPLGDEGTWEHRYF